MRIWTAFAAGLALLVTSMPAWAQDASREVRVALAERAVTAMQGDQMTGMVHQVAVAFEPGDLDDLPPDIRTAYDNVMPRATAWMMARVLEGTVEIYADIYTLEELEALVGFYESPLGQSIMTKAYAASPQIVELTQSLVPEMMMEVVNGVCDEIGCTPSERRDFLAETMASINMQVS